MWHQFTLHALTYCRLCKDAGTCRAPLMVPEPRLRYGQSGLKRQSPRVPPPGSTLIIRSYQGENTGSHPNSEVKHPWACSVLRWGTTRESQVTNVFASLLARLNLWEVRDHNTNRASGCIKGSYPRLGSYLLGLLAKIKCSICSYQLNL